MKRGKLRRWEVEEIVGFGEIVGGLTSRSCIRKWGEEEESSGIGMRNHLPMLCIKMLVIVVLNVLHLYLEAICFII